MVSIVSYKNHNIYVMEMPFGVGHMTKLFFCYFCLFFQKSSNMVKLKIILIFCRFCAHFGGRAKSYFFPFLPIFCIYWAILAEIRVHYQIFSADHVISFHECMAYIRLEMLIILILHIFQFLDAKNIKNSVKSSILMGNRQTMNILE